MVVHLHPFSRARRSYEAFVNGSDAQLPEVPLQYVEYAQWQRKYLTGEVLDKQVAYWKKNCPAHKRCLISPPTMRALETHSWHGATVELTLKAKFLPH